MKILLVLLFLAAQTMPVRAQMRIDSITFERDSTLKIASIMTLHGNFSSSSHHLEVAGRELPIVSASISGIQAIIADTGKESSGELVLTNGTDTVRSLLTVWTIKIYYYHNEPHSVPSNDGWTAFLRLRGCLLESLLKKERKELTLWPLSGTTYYAESYNGWQVQDGLEQYFMHSKVTLQSSSDYSSGFTCTASLDSSRGAIHANFANIRGLVQTHKWDTPNGPRTSDRILDPRAASYSIELAPSLAVVPHDTTVTVQLQETKQWQTSATASALPDTALLALQLAPVLLPSQPRAGNGHPQIRWQSRFLNQVHRLEIAADSTFIDTHFVQFISQNSTIDSFEAASDVFKQGRYYYRVRVQNSWGLSDWSTTGTFATAKAAVSPEAREDLRVAGSKLLLTLKEPAEISITIHDLLGREERRFSAECGSGPQSLDLGVLGLTPGVHLANVTYLRHTRVVKFLVR